MIIGFFQSLFSFVNSLFTGLVNLVKMIPQTIEAVSFFGLMFPAWVWILIYSTFGFIVSLALLKWIKGIV